MRDKIVIYRKFAFKTAKRTSSPKKSETIQKIQLESEKRRIWRSQPKKGCMLWWSYLQNQPLDRAYVLIYLSSHKPLCPDRRDLNYHISERHWQYPGKQKETHLAELFRLSADFSLLHRGITFIFGYVVCLDVVFILDGGDWKHTL